MWTSWKKWEWRDINVHLWRSDSGLWGYRHNYYDVYCHCIGFGKFLYISWGPR